MDSFLKSAEEKFGGQINQNDLLKQAQNFVASQAGSGEKQSSSNTTHVPTGPGGTGGTGGDGTGEAASKVAQTQSQGHADILGNAKTLYQGIQDKMSGKEVDDKHLAGAASQLLQAAKTSGLDKDGRYTDYFTKAEGYLQKYSQGGQGATGTAAAPKSDFNTSKESSAAPPKE